MGLRLGISSRQGDEMRLKSAHVEECNDLF